MIKMNVNHDMSENVPYNKADFSLYAFQGVLSTYPNYSAISHWHIDTEFIYVYSGTMDYNINGKIVHLEANDGLFVNSKQIHYGFSANHNECIFICILIHPMLLCTSPYIEQHFVKPILENNSLSYILLKTTNEKHNNIIKALKEIYNKRQLPNYTSYELNAQSLIFTLWENLFSLSNAENNMQKNKAPRNQHLTILKDMISFINNNYTEKISLEDISLAGNVSKTTCTNIFVKYINRTPFAYLTEYRLKKSAELLLSTDYTISEICYEVGFSSASYYTETFKKNYNITPKEYRHLNT